MKSPRAPARSSRAGPFPTGVDRGAAAEAYPRRRPASGRSCPCTRWVFFERVTRAVHEGPDSAVIHLQATPPCAPAILRGGCPPVPAGAPSRVHANSSKARDPLLDPPSWDRPRCTGEMNARAPHPIQTESITLQRGKSCTLGYIWPSRRGGCGQPAQASVVYLDRAVSGRVFGFLQPLHQTFGCLCPLANVSA